MTFMLDGFLMNSYELSFMVTWEVVLTILLESLTL